MAKKFFYVCAGLLMLTLAYHLGARSAAAQAPSSFTVMPWGNVVYVGDQGFQLYSYNGWHPLEASAAPPVAPSSLIYLNPGAIAITRDGEGWYKPADQWISAGPVPGLSATTHQTWGQVKARYR